MENWGKNMDEMITLESTIDLIGKIHDDIQEEYMDAIRDNQPHDLETERIIGTLTYAKMCLEKYQQMRSAE